MDYLPSGLWKTLIFAVQIAFVYGMVRLFVVGKPTFNLFKKGWGSLYETYSVTAVPAGMHSTSALIGAVRYGNTIDIKVDEDGLYLKKSFFGSSCVFIPLRSISVVESPKRTTILLIPVETNGLFVVDGVEISLSVEYSKILIDKLASESLN